MMSVERDSDYTVWQTSMVDHFSLKQLKTLLVAVWASLETFSFLVRIQSSPALYPGKDSHHLLPKYSIHPPIFGKILKNNYVLSWKHQERRLLWTNQKNPHVGIKPANGKTHQSSAVAAITQSPFLQSSSNAFCSWKRWFWKRWSI